MNITLSAPSKTFLTGEYAVLAGGPALVLNTGPRFLLHAHKGTSSIRGIPSGSPADIWFRQRAPLLKDWEIEFVDPHAGRGGFGASGAQFLLAHAFTTRLQSADDNAQDLLQDFRVCSQQGSGADVLAQFAGEVAMVNVDQALTQTLNWAYPELAFAVIRTGQKIPTHTHLQNIDKKNLASLLTPAQEACASFGSVTAREFVDNVIQYSRALRELNLQCPQTLALLAPLQEQTWCLAAKGCGAFGADTIVLLFEKQNAAQAKEFVRQQNLEWVSDELSTGLA